MQHLTEPVTLSPRYQAAILRDGKMLLIMHREHNGGREYWVIPGGGREVGETEEECVAREALEETHLVVAVGELLLTFDHPKPNVIQKMKTYHCTILAGEESPGYEPEEHASSIYSIVAVRWVDLRDEASWGNPIFDDPFTCPQLKSIQQVLRSHRAL